MDKIKVLFVCLGNICRSPMAAGLFTHLVEEAGLADRFEIDSAGTSAYHVGELADKRMRTTAASHGIRLTSRARQIRRQDLSDFDYILAMDRANFANIEGLKQPSATYRSEIVTMRTYDAENQGPDVPDPYYGGAGGFEEVYAILLRSNEEFLRSLREKHGL
ncbi:MAG: low molecular weight protein-tyrosine-phosphatase [Bacteroidota bacterium]